MSKLVKIPVGQKVNMSKGAKVVFQVTSDNWIELEVTEDINGLPFQVTDTQISNVFYRSDSNESFGKFIQNSSDSPPTSTFDPLTPKKG